MPEPIIVAEQARAKIKPTRHRLTRPYWWQFAIIMLATFLASLLTVIYPALLGQIIDSVIGKNASVLHTIVFLLIGLAAAQAFISFLQSSNRGNINTPDMIWSTNSKIT